MIFSVDVVKALDKILCICQIYNDEVRVEGRSLKLLKTRKKPTANVTINGKKTDFPIVKEKKKQIRIPDIPNFI